MLGCKGNDRFIQRICGIGGQLAGQQLFKHRICGDSVLRLYVQRGRQLFFEVRLGDNGNLVAAVQKNYEPDDFQTELPLTLPVRQ